MNENGLKEEPRAEERRRSRAVRDAVGERVSDAARGAMKAGANDISFHMPGHKRRMLFGGQDFLKYDQTELPGYDNLLHPTGWLLDLTRRIQSFYGSLDSRILVGGSTSGMLAAVMGAAAAVRTEAGRTPCAIVNRNAHISIFNALEMADVEATFLPPICDRGIPSHFDTDAWVQRAQHYDICILTYPFYHGGMYDIETMIARLRTRNPQLLILVDEAHGAHLRLDERRTGRKRSALSFGADIVVQSFHKTLPALGSSAVLHYGATDGGRMLHACRNQLRSVEWHLKALQTTSPSYLMLASISQMMDILEDRGVNLYSELLDDIASFYLGIRRTPFSYRLSERVPGQKPTEQDPTKILLSFPSQRPFIERGIFPEMEDAGHVLFLTSIANEKSDFEALSLAVREIGDTGTLPSADASFPFGEAQSAEAADFASADALSRAVASPSVGGLNLLRYGQSHVDARVTEAVRASEANGKISAETIVMYPPGTPLIVAGERFEREVCAVLREEEVRVRRECPDSGGH